VVKTMDVKDVFQISGARSAPSKPGKAVSSKTLISSRVTAQPSDSVYTSGVNNRAPSAKAQAVRATNEVINTANVAADEVSRIGTLVESIGGIVELANQPSTSPERAGILEQEAQELAGEIQRRAQTPSASGLRPLGGDKIRLELEEGLGRNLEILLPTDAQSAFGLGTIKFPNKEAILDAVEKVAVARQQIESLRGAVDDTVQSLRKTVAELDVADQNAAASQASVRDVDLASNLAKQTGQGITASPISALGSVAALDSQILGLLE
jgi:hypothetical protein